MTHLTKKKRCYSCASYKGFITRLKDKLHTAQLFSKVELREKQRWYKAAQDAMQNYYGKCVDVVKLKNENRRLKGEPPIIQKDVKNA